VKVLITRLLLRIVEKSQLTHRSLMDRLYEVVLPCRFAECGKGVHIYYPAHITGWRNIVIGNNVHINRNAFIRANGGLEVRDNVHIGSNSVIYTINHNYMGSALPYDHTIVRKPVVIEKNVWIGMNVVIIPGVTIGEGAIIGAGTVVSRDIPRLAIVGSPPPRIIKFRDEGHYIDLEKRRCYGGVNGYLYKVKE